MYAQEKRMDLWTYTTYEPPTKTIVKFKNAMGAGPKGPTQIELIELFKNYKPAAPEPNFYPASAFVAAIRWPAGPRQGYSRNNGRMQQTKDSVV